MKHVITVLFALFVGGVSCGDIGESDKCIMDGNYQYMMFPSPGCEPLNQVFEVHSLEDECYQDINNLTDDGLISGYVSCEPGSPVKECDGYASSTECEWRIQVRWIGK